MRVLADGISEFLAPHIQRFGELETRVAALEKQLATMQKALAGMRKARKTKP
jgi:hypothetical protein